MSKNVRNTAVGVLIVLISSGVIGAIGWMRSVDNNTYRTAEILERIQSDNVELKGDVKKITGLVIQNSERLNEHDRRLDDHQRKLDHIDKKNGG